MNKTVIVGIMSIMLIAAASYATINGTAHDFTDGVGDETWNDSGEMCLPCHTPHNAKDHNEVHPLWNHDYQGSSSFQVWEGAVLGAESLTCLSCHDGTTALDAFGHNGSNAVTKTMGDVYAAGNLGTDLLNDHPVGVKYPTSGGRYSPIGSIWGGQPAIQSSGFGGLPIFGEGGSEQVECATCHTPHGSVNPYMLRISNEDSDLCATCHSGHADWPHAWTP